MSLVVRRATAAEIMPLRQAVLRPGLPAAASAYPNDDVAVHVGAWTDGDEPPVRLVGCATVFPEPWPGSPEAAAEPLAWRLRGMAVTPERQRLGVGRMVLAAAVEAARGAGGPVLWANARVPALPFYVAMGWTIAGEEFRTPDTGLPHRAIVLPLHAPAPAAG